MKKEQLIATYLVVSLVVLAGLTIVSINQMNKLHQQQSANSEIFATMQTLSQKYAQLNNLCENKYQTGIAGDFQTAYTIKGQIEQLQTEIKQLESKYISGSNL